MSNIVQSRLGKLSYVQTGKKLNSNCSCRTLTDIVA